MTERKSLMWEALDRLAHRRDLREVEARRAMTSVMRGEASPLQVAGLAMGMAGKGVTAAELTAFVRTVREFSEPFPGPSEVLDTCGTGGDGHGTFNISSTAAVVAAACGVPVAKHGSRSVSSRCGSADVLEALGVNVDLPPRAAARCLEEAGITFLSATVFHPAFKHAMGPIRELGVRTVFNLLGPLCNPAQAQYQIIGVPDEDAFELLADALELLGAAHVMVFCPQDGLDELSTSAPARVAETREGRTRRYVLDPAALGLAAAAPGSLTGGTPEQNADLTRRVLAGERGPRRDIVLLNTAAALRIAGGHEDWGRAMARAAEAIDDGTAHDVLDRWVRVSQAR
ncbi:anthranilate phosphoribosyltransferase [Streptomyces californicus]|uniref:anthranilate phosphoribosyltransferase n=2 Tax=Streptomyces californicus TaxID=67351 RepID=UPI000AC78AC9|nr:anthranilate phosphoribosyltransferase [Streptomyces californicus]